jgi:segregation and condensation protein B
MPRSENIKIVEALLFACLDPLTQAQVNAVFEIDAPLLSDVIGALQEEYNNNDYAFMILEVAGGYQLVSRPEYETYIRRLIHKTGKLILSQAALETLAIIAYKQPVSRVEIESIRGVDSSAVLKTLFGRKLILIKGRDAGPGRPLLYATTTKYLEHFGLINLSDMPKMSEITELIDATKDRPPQIDAFK